MRIAVLLALVLASTPLPAQATGGGHHGGGHHGHGHGHGGGGGGGGGGGPTASVTGAGQRQAFSFGGSVRLAGNKATGEFVLVAHPLSPASTTVSVACRYRKFNQVSITGTTATFRGMGKCSRLLTSGEIENFEAVNVFQIVDNPAGDQIDVNFEGASGLAIPAGALDFGDFTVTPAA